MADTDVTTDLGMCPGCHGKFRLYIGRWDRHGRTVRCLGCLRIPQECRCG